jgi:16S rRNA processing protein RimM
VIDARTGSEIGKIEDVQFGAGEAPLLVVKSGTKERLIPFAAAYLKAVEPAQKRIEVELPEGMLELDAPLTAEEKAQQRNKDRSE